MSAYADTSFLLPLYLVEPHTPRCVTAMRAATEPVVVTPLNELEFANALELRCFRKQITEELARGAWSNFQSDLAGAVYSLVPVPAEAFSMAVRLARRHSAKEGGRSLDILHVACALTAGADAFYTFDKVQSRLAALEGLRIL